MMFQCNCTLTRYLYNIAPCFIKTGLANFYGYIASEKKYGKHFFFYYDYLKKCQHLSFNELKRYQNRQLHKLIVHAVKNIPYYTNLFKKLNLIADDIRTVNDLKKLPVLTKEDVRKNFNSLQSSKNRSRDIRSECTSGTTGKALKFIITKKAFQKEQACVWFHRSWAGIKFKDATAVISGHLVTSHNRNKPPFWLKNVSENQIIFSPVHLKKNNLKYYIEKLHQFQPKLIWGYPSSIYLLAIYLLDNKVDTIRPEAIFTSSETLWDFQRTAIEKAFQTKVYNYYSNSENVAKILECEKGGYHIQHLWGIVEFLDQNDNPVKSGEEGRMICTSFVNDAMPLIRYDIGDVAIPIDKKCDCGREGQLVKEILGRYDDYLLTSDGRYLGIVGGFFKDIPNVQEAQIIQNEVNSILVKIKNRTEYTEKDTMQIIKQLQKILGCKVRIDVEEVDCIPRSPNGKYKLVVSNIKKESLLTLNQ